MDPFWQTDEASFESARKAQRRASAAQPTAAEAVAPFLAQIEQTLGMETMPDSEFFIDSWTVGFAAASQNFLRRQERLTTRAHELPAWHTFSFTPRFVEKAEASAAAAWPLREDRADERSTADLRWVDDEKEDDWLGPDEVEIEGPPTRESACRVLGVAVTSTQEQIRSAYRKMASRYHPDRLAHGDAREKRLASDRMASINEAYRLLNKGVAEPSRSYQVG
jgi:DnaJ-domain-containing protein 1